MPNFYHRVSSLVQAIKNCAASDNVEWLGRHTETLESIVKTHAPGGSGFDMGTKLDPDECTDGALRFTTSFHHMDEHGSYDGWTDHVVTVKPAFDGVHVRVSGRNRNDIKDYIAEQFHYLNSVEVSQ